MAMVVEQRKLGGRLPVGLGENGASKEGRNGRGLLLFDCCLISPCKKRHSAFSTPWVG